MTDEKALREIITTLNKCKISYEILLIENGSRDNSPEIVKTLSKKYKYVYSFVSQKGYGNAVLKGLKESKGKFVCYMPSDGQIDLNVFPKLLKYVGKYDLVKIKRIKRENFIRDLTSWTFNHSLSFIFGTELTDVNGSPRIFLKTQIPKLKLQAKDSFIDAEFLIKISKLNWTIKEIPMGNIERYGGKSTRNLNTYVEFFKNIYDYKFSHKFKNWQKTIKI